MSSPTLAISAPTHENVEIYGVAYQVALPRDLTLERTQDVERWWVRSVTLEAKRCTKCPTEGVESAKPCRHRVLTKAEKTEYRLINLSLAQAVLPDAEEVLEELETVEHQAIVMRFFDGGIRSVPEKWIPLFNLAVMTHATNEASAALSQRSSISTRERTRSSG